MEEFHILFNPRCLAVQHVHAAKETWLRSLKSMPIPQVELLGILRLPTAALGLPVRRACAQVASRTSEEDTD